MPSALDKTEDVMVDLSNVSQAITFLFALVIIAKLSFQHLP
jgi:hypothetical protein